MIRFQILQLDEGGAPALGWAKQQAQRLIEASIPTFNKTWIVGAATVRARGVEFMGDVLVKLWVSVATQNVVVNQLARGYNWRQPINFKLDAQSPDKVAWYDAIVPVVLPALGRSVQFSVAPTQAGADPTVNFDGALKVYGPTGFGNATKLLQTFRAHVLAGREAAIRHWFGILTTHLTLTLQGHVIPADASEMLVSQPSSGNFFLLWGRWSDDNRAPYDQASPTPREIRYQGVIVSINDLLLQAPKAKQSTTSPGFLAINLDTPVTAGGYLGPQLVGRLFGDDGTTAVAQGVDYRRLDLGLFPFNAGDLFPPFRYRYRPDQGGQANGSPYAVAYLDKTGISLGGGAETWTYTFERHRLSSSGSIVVEPIPLPALAAFHQHTTHGAFEGTVTVSFSGYTADMALFDGMDFLKFGNIVQTPSNYVEVDHVETTNVDGTVTAQTCLPSTTLQGKFAPSGSFDMLIRELGIAWTAGKTITGDQVLRAAEFNTVRSSDSKGVSLFLGSPDAPRLPLTMGGPAWGTYQRQSGSSDFAEVGFNSMGFGAGSAPTMSFYRPPNGVFWFRADGSMGVFLYIALQDINADCLKYRNVYQGVSGYQRHRGADGSVISVDAGWEDPSAILARIMPSIRIDVNNFGTPAMIPWLNQPFSAGVDLVIVDG